MFARAKIKLAHIPPDLLEQHIPRHLTSHIAHFFGGHVLEIVRHLAPAS